VHRHNDLAAIRVTPFLVASFLGHQCKAVPLQDPNDLPRVADWEVFAHGTATSKTVAPSGIGSDEGSNQSSRASLALATASASVSPADAQPGNSGKNAAHRRVRGSCSTTNRSFMINSLRSQEEGGNLRSAGSPQARKASRARRVAGRGKGLPADAPAQTTRPAIYDESADGAKQIEEALVPINGPGVVPRPTSRSDGSQA